MFTTVVLWVIAIGWLVANGMWAQRPSPVYARRRAVWAWVLLGACIGAAAGWAVGHLAFAGALLGGAVAGLVAGQLGKGRAGTP